MNPEAISRLAVELGWEDAQLQRLHASYIRKHGERADEKLAAWLKAAERGMRERRLLLSERGVPPYTESPSEAMNGEPEAVPPEEIESYRDSRRSRLRFQGEVLDDYAPLLGAMQEVRNSLDALPGERKKKISRYIWTFKTRMDVLEREIRRNAAA